MAERFEILEEARRETGLSMSELWFRYFSLGGMRTALEVEAYLYGALASDDHDRDLLAVAINERFAEQGRGNPIPYTGEDA